MLGTVYLNDEKVLSVVQGEALTLVMRLLDSLGKPIDLSAATAMRLELPGLNSRTLKCLGTSATFASTDVDADENMITLADHGLAPNQIVRLTGAGLPTGLAAGIDYYVIVLDKDSFQLSATENGAAIDITAVGSGTNTLVYAPLSLADDNDGLLGKVTVVLSAALTAALQDGEKQSLEFHYTKATGEKQIVQAQKSLSVAAQVL